MQSVVINEKRKQIYYINSSKEKKSKEYIYSNMGFNALIENYIRK